MQDHVEGDKVGRDKIIYNAPPTPPPPPMMAPPKPLVFVERPAEYERLVALLSAGTGGAPVGITAALRGAGGFGKTTLAQVVCHDPQVRAAFPDGILWLTLGEQPGDLRAPIARLVTSLTGARLSFGSVLEAANALDAALGNRACLLVVDDVWSAGDLHPFLQGGPRCTRLVTTRDGGTLPRNTVSVVVDELQDDQALDLLAFGLIVVAALRPRLGQLAARLGGWALLLALTNGVLRERTDKGETLSEALHAVEAELARRGLTAFDANDAQQRTAAAALTIEVSRAQLPARQRERHAELAIFPEDLAIPLDAVAHLWSATGKLDAIASEELCLRLDQRSLLRYDAEAKTLRLHDVVRSYLRQQHRRKLPGWHRKLLDSYRHETRDTRRETGDRQLPTANWRLMTASYLWDNLGYHLEGGGLVDELVTTVCDLRYLVRKMTLRDENAVEADLNRAQRLRFEDETLVFLERSVRLYGHVLRRCADEYERAATLAAYLSGFPLLETAVDGLMPLLSRPRLTPLHPIATNHPALLRTLEGHSGGVSSVAFSPDGSRILSGANDGTLKLWDARSASLLQTLEGHTKRVYSVAFSPDGSRILSGSSDCTLNLWNAQSGSLLQTIEGHTGAMTSVAFSPDGSRILAGSGYGSLKLWDAGSGSLLHTLAGHTGGMTSVAFSPNGSRILSGAEDDTLKLWDALSGSLLHTLAGHSRGVYSVAFSPDGSRLLSGSGDGTLKLWDVLSGSLLHTFAGHSWTVSSVTFSSDGSHLLSGSHDGTLKLWDVLSGSLLHTLAGHSGRVYSVTFSPDGSRILSGAEDDTLKLWDALSSSLLQTPTGHSDRVTGVAFSPDGSRLLSGSFDRTIKLWDAHSGSLLDTLTGHTGRVNSVAYSPDGSRTVSGSSDRTLRLWDARSGSLLHTLESHTDWLMSVAYSPDGSRILSASLDCMLQVWSAFSSSLLQTLAGDSLGMGISIIKVSYSPDGSRILAGSSDGTLKLWDALSGSLLYTLTDHSGRVYSVAFSPDGSRILSGSHDGKLKLWDALSGSLLHTLTGHSGRVYSVAYSSDGSRLLSGAEDRTLKLWDAHSGSCLATFHAEGALRCCTFAPDGRTVAAGGDDRQVYILKVEG